MKYIFQTTKHYRFQFFLLFLTIIFSTVTGALFPYAIGKIVDQIFYVQQMKGFLLYFFLYAGLYFVNQCLHGGLNYVWAHLKITYVVDIRKQCFKHLMKLKAGIWTNIKSGDVMKRILDDTECFLEFIHRSVFYVFADILQLLFFIGYMMFTNVYLGLVAVIMTPLLAYSIRYFTAKLKVRYEKIENRKGLVDAWILEMMTGIVQWKLLNAQEKVKDDYQKKTKEVVQEEISAGYLDLASENINEALTLAGQMVIFCIAAFSVGKEMMTIGQFVACAAYFSSCAAYFNALGRKLSNISVNLVGIRRVEEFLGWEEEKDIPAAKPHTIINGSIQFEKVSFGYLENQILKELDLKIEAGEKIALVGKSGEGKSTLLSLLYRFYDPQNGNIYIDGKKISTYTLESLRSQIAVVQQDNGLFYGSLRKNITLSDDKSVDKRVIQILEGLHLKELMAELPEGLDTVVGTGGRELSGGQKQRIAIARCIFQQPKILLLDVNCSTLLRCA